MTIPAAGTTAELTEEQRLTGLGGWLILPIIGLTFTIVFTSINLFSAMQGDALAAYTAFFNGVLPEAAKNYVYVGLVSCFFGVLLIAMAIACLIALALRKRYLPKMMIAYYILLFIAAAYEFYGVWSLPALRIVDDNMYEAVRGLAQGVIAAGLWIPYFVVSKRVQYTFTR